ncbi:MAG: accessory gene regulator B family protein [Lachnospiraceae bacterium]|nr:accessory gene regulator B family protein [Lachnospiraceae bacterium]
MSVFFANLLVNKMIINDVIDCGKREEYIYTLQLLIEKLIGIVLVYVFALSIGKIVETTLFFITYSTVRKYSGGFHCRTEAGCLIASIGFVIFSILIEAPLLLEHKIVTNIIYLFAVCFILIVGPINHPNMNWSKKEYKRSKKTSSRIVLLFSILLILSELIGLPIRTTIFIRIGMINAIALIVLAKITKQEVKQHEQ